MVHNGLIRGLNQELMGFVFHDEFSVVFSSSWHCAVCFHPLPGVGSGPGSECSPPASYSPWAYVIISGCGLLGE